ncbi:MAG TPA: hypothetical protein VI894_02075 [Candidatus Nanoarchaeia archaeon]|nr:hypothetical protein [Candidatus Nanoarchaeia archaeon]
MKLFSSRKKKADLSLSVNAIVILILAITMLGLGLAFVRGLFKQAQNKITDIIDVTEITDVPSYEKSVTVTPLEPTIKLGDTKTLKIAFKNVLPSRACALLVPTFTTTAGTTITAPAGSGLGKLPISTLPKKVEKDEIAGWSVPIVTSGSLTGNVPQITVITFTVKAWETTASCQQTAPANTRDYPKDIVVTVTP